MTSTQIFYLSLLAFGFGVVTLRFIKLYRQAQLEKNRYRLYKIRDKLIRLVAEEKISEDNILFQTYYRALTVMLKHTRSFTLGRFIEAAKKVEKDISPEDEKHIDKLRAELKSAHPEVRETITEFFVTSLQIMIDNSLLLKLLLKLVTIAKKKLSVREYPNHLPRPRSYDTYTDYENIRRKLQLA